MKNFIVIVVILGGIGWAVVHFTGSSDKVKDAISKSKDKSAGYKKKIDPKHKDDKVAYEKSKETVDRCANELRNALKQGEEAIQAKADLGAALKKFKKANEKMNKLGYLYEDQYDFNVKRINSLEDDLL